MKNLRFLTVVVVMVAAFAVLTARGDVDRVPASTPLSEMPMSMAQWNGTDIPLDDEVLHVLGKGVFLNRNYLPTGSGSSADEQAQPEATSVGLFIGYFPTQRTGQSIHSPQHCLPGSGWVFDKSGVTDITTENGKPVQVGEYIISNGPVRAEVLYWYRSHGRSIASDYTAKFYTLTDSIRYGRTDAALVRIVTPIRLNEDPQIAHDRAVAFAKMINPLLPSFIPN